MDILFSVVKIAVAAYVGFGLLVYFRQGSYIYYPDRHVGLTPKYAKMAYSDISLKTEDDEVIAGWFVPASENPETAVTILFCHGNGGDIGDRVGSVRTFHDLGCHVCIFDYRGYGNSSGKPSENGTYTDARAVWKYLTEEKGIPPGRIVLFGRSLGGAIATWLAEEMKPKGLIVESSFTSAADMGAKMFHILPVRLLSRYKYDSLARLPAVHCPVLVAHSREDHVIPFEHGERLFKAANEPKRFIEMRGGHNDGGLDTDTAYQKILKEFLLTR